MTLFLPDVANGLFFVYVPFREAVGSMTSWISDLPYQLWTPGKPDAVCGFCSSCRCPTIFRPIGKKESYSSQLYPL